MSRGSRTSPSPRQGNKIFYFAYLQCSYYHLFTQCPFSCNSYRRNLIAGSLDPCVPFVQWLVSQNDDLMNWGGRFVSSADLYCHYCRFCKETETESLIKGSGALTKKLRASFPNLFEIQRTSDKNGFCFDRNLLDRISHELERQNLDADPPRNTCSHCNKGTFYLPSKTKMCLDCCEKELMIHRDRESSQKEKERSITRIKEENSKLKRSNAKLERALKALTE